VTNGPFGLVSSIETAGPGWFDNLGSNADSLATLNFNGQPMLAVINPGTLGTGSGGVVIYSDTILANNEAPGGKNEYMSADNQTLARNSIAFLSAGGATPNGGTVTFSDQNGAIGSETLVDGVATLTTSSLAVGTNTVTDSYGGTADFDPSTSGTIVTVTILPAVPIEGTAPTRTVLTAQPRPANIGRPVTLTATVKDLKHRAPIPAGSVTFLDGTASLGTVALRHGKASLKTSSLPLGPNTIQAYYIPGQGFAPSTASVVENVRAHRSRSKAAPAAETGRRAVPSTSLAIRLGGVAAIPIGAVTIVGGSTVLGPIGANPGRAARSDSIPAATRRIRTAHAGTDNGILGGRVWLKQAANQSIPKASNVAGMGPRPDGAV
jgi:Bacterial Ig-like domain (group 3)